MTIEAANKTRIPSLPAGPASQCARMLPASFQGDPGTFARPDALESLFHFHETVSLACVDRGLVVISVKNLDRERNLGPQVPFARAPNDGMVRLDLVNGRTVFVRKNPQSDALEIVVNLAAELAPGTWRVLAGRVYSGQDELVPYRFDTSVGEADLRPPTVEDSRSRARLK